MTESLDRMEAEGGGDLVGELAFTLPFDVISEMLGMPDADKDKVRTWSEEIVKTLEENEWNQTRAAEALGISRDNLRYRLRKYQISRPADD